MSFYPLVKINHDNIDSSFFKPLQLFFLRSIFYMTSFLFFFFTIVRSYINNTYNNFPRGDFSLDVSTNWINAYKLANLCWNDVVPLTIRGSAVLLQFFPFHTRDSLKCLLICSFWLPFQLVGATFLIRLVAFQSTWAHGFNSLLCHLATWNPSREVSGWKKRKWSEENGVDESIQADIFKIGKN